MTFPSVQGRDKQVSATSDASSWTIPFPVGWDTNLAGDRIYAFVSVDQDTTLTIDAASPGWSSEATLNSTLQARGYVFLYEVGADNEAIPDLVLNASSAQQFSSVSLWVRSSTGTLAHLAIGSASGSSTDSNPPSVTNGTGASIDALVVASRHGDSTVVPSAAPSGYTDWQSQVAGGTLGVSTDTAEKQATLAAAASEDPGVWTVASEQWVCFTVGIYESSGGGTDGYVKVNISGTWTLKPVKVWNGSAWVIKPAKYWNGSAWVAA